MYPTNRDIAQTLSGTARVLTALLLAVLGLCLTGGLAVCLYTLALGNGFEGVRQYVERADLMGGR